MRGRTAKLELLEFHLRWLDILYAHVAFGVLHGHGGFLFGWFLL